MLGGGRAMMAARGVFTVVGVDGVVGFGGIFVGMVRKVGEQLDEDSLRICFWFEHKAGLIREYF